VRVAHVHAHQLKWQLCYQHPEQQRWRQQPVRVEPAPQLPSKRRRHSNVVCLCRYCSQLHHHHHHLNMFSLFTLNLTSITRMITNITIISFSLSSSNLDLLFIFYYCFCSLQGTEVPLRSYSLTLSL